MRLLDWLLSTEKCGQCGTRIIGLKYACSVLGVQFWICESCKEKERQERERTLSEEKQRAGRASPYPPIPNVDIRTRSDVDIAEVLSRIVIQEFGALNKEASLAVGKDARIKPVEAFTFVLAAVSYALRRWTFQLDAARLDVIEDKLARFSFAGFIHQSFVNPPPEFAESAPDRQKLLLELMARLAPVSKAHQHNIGNALELAGKKEYEAFAGWLVRLTRVDLFDLQDAKDSSFVPLTDPRSMALTQCVWRVVDRAMKCSPQLMLKIAAIATIENSRMAIEMPDSWLLRQKEPYLYYDPCTPQYNFQISVLKTSSSAETPVAFLHRLLAAPSPSTEPEAVGAARAIAQYRSITAELGQAKDDYHWCLADNETGPMRSALFTLSVLTSRADREATSALVASLTDRIRRARFRD